MAAAVTHLVEYLETSATQMPERPAVVEPDGTTLTYSALHEQACRVAAFLMAQGVQPGDRVGLLLPKSATTVATLYGVMKARAAYVPLDWTAPTLRLQAILTDCRLRALFVHPSRLPVLQELASEVQPQMVVMVAAGTGHTTPAGVTVRAMSWEQVQRHAPLPHTARSSTRHDLAYILYTSGSTGTPKGVMLTQENATSFIEWCSTAFQPTAMDRFSSHAPFHFDLSVLDLFLAAKHGASVYLISDELGKNARQLPSFIAHNQITIWYSAPSILGLMAEFGTLSKHPCPALRLVLFAGEVFPVKRLRALTTLWPHPQYYNLYGPTETNVCTYARIPLPIPEHRTEPFPIGPVCSHCEAMVLDALGQPVEQDAEGLLYITGPAVFQGYWHRPEESSRCFLTRQGKRWYNTGDIVRAVKDVGFLYVGRQDRMVKRRGYRIELSELENVLYRHAQVRDAGVIAVTEPGEDCQIAAYVVLTPAAPPSLIEMKLFCAQHLPVYMSPDQFIFVDALPRTSTAKIDYQELRRQFQTRP